MLDAADSRSLALLYHLNSEPWPGSDVNDEPALDVYVKEAAAAGPPVPLPETEPGSPLLQLIRARSSCRQFAAEPLALADLAALLDGTYGLGRSLPFPDGLELRLRTVPSAGGLYPLEAYLVVRSVESLEPGLYHFNAVAHELEPLRLGIDDDELATFLIAAPFLENANAILILAAVFERSLHKYGPRGYRFILLEAGHAAQNLCLLAAERNLASLCVGGFVDAPANRFLGLNPLEEAVVYCVGIGHPA